MQKFIAFLFASFGILNLQAQLINFSPALKPDDQLTYYIFKERINASKLNKKSQANDDTIILHMICTAMTDKGAAYSVYYDYSKSSITKKEPDFNYILAKTQEGTINFETDESGSITQITNRIGIRQRYKEVLEKLKKTAREEDKPVYDDLADEMNEDAQLDYLLLEDLEILFGVWNSQFELNNQYSIESEIESPYSVRNIPSEGLIKVFPDAKNKSDINVQINYAPHPEKAATELNNIRKVLSESLIIPKDMADEDIFTVSEQFSYVFNTSIKRFTFASKLRVHKEAGKDKLTITKIILAK